MTKLILRLFKLLLIGVMLALVVFAGYKIKSIINFNSLLYPAGFIAPYNQVYAEGRFLKLARPLATAKTISSLSVSGWIPEWDMVGAVATLQSQIKTFNTISPVYFFVNPDGSLKTAINLQNNNLKNFEKLAIDNNVQIIPAIQDFDADNLSAMLSSPENIRRHNQAIQDFLVNSKYAGIDLDYEATYLKDKPAFFNMLTDLSTRLKKINKKFVFTVLPKWGNQITYSFPQTRQVQDWGKIAMLVDELRIMTYELYGSGTIAGPIGPLDWLEANIQYAIFMGVPRNKIMLGINTYSYDWGERNIASNIDLTKLSNKNYLAPDLPLGEAMYNKGINVIKQNYKFDFKYFKSWAEAIGTYVDKGENRIVVFPTNQTFIDKKNLAAKYGIKGVVYWRIGEEDGLSL